MRIKLFLVCLLLVLSVSIQNAYADKILSYTVAAANTDDNGAKLLQADIVPFMWMPYSNTTRPGYTRWSVRIPANATIVSAAVDFVVSPIYTGTANSVSVDLINLTDCPSLVSNASALPVAGSPVSGTFSGTWSSGNTVTTPDLKTLIDAYVALEGYSSGKYLGLKYYNTSTSAYSAVGCYGSGKPAVLKIVYSGGDVTIDNWMAEPHTRTKQYIYPHFYNHDEGDVAYVYLDDSLIHTYTFLASDIPSNPADYKEKVFLMDYTALMAGEHHIDIEVKTSGGVSRGTTVKTWTTTHDKYPAVGINENNAICIADPGDTSCTVMFPIASFMYDESRWYNCATTGVCWPFSSAMNGLHTIGYATSHTADTAKAFMDKAAATTDPESGRSWFVAGPGRGEYEPLRNETGLAINQYKLGLTDLNGTPNGHYYKCTKAGYAHGRGVQGIGTTTTNVKINASNYLINGTEYWTAGSAAGVALPAQTIPQNRYGLYRFSIAAGTEDNTADHYPVKINGTITVTPAANNATTGYSYEDLTDTDNLDTYGIPKSAPALPADSFDLGYIIVSSSDAEGFIAGTTALNAADVTVKYYGRGYYTPTYCTASGCVQHEGSIELTEQGEDTTGVTGWIATNNSNCSTPSSSHDCSYVYRLKDHAANLGWLWRDEVGLGSNWQHITPTNVTSWMNAVRSVDTDHPVWVSHYGYDFQVGSSTTAQTVAYKYSWLTSQSYYSGVKTWTGDIIGGDTYPYSFVWRNANPIVNTLEAMLTEVDSYYVLNYGLVPVVPALMANMGSGIGVECTRPIKLPLAHQLTNELWLRVIHGSKGVNYFITGTCGPESYQTEAAVKFKTYMEGSLGLDKVVGEKNSTKMTAATRIVSVPGVGNVTVPMHFATTVAGTDGRVDYMIKDYGGKTYVFAARVKKANINTEVGETFETFNDCTDYSSYTNAFWPSGDHNFCISNNLPLSQPSMPKTTKAKHWPDPANTNIKSATITIPGLAVGTTVVRLGEGTSLTTTVANQLTDNFTDYDVHIYQYGGEVEADTDAPTVDTFVIPEKSVSTTVDISSFHCSDNIGVSHYCTTEVNSSAGCSWVTSAPATMTFSEAGSKTGYGWCKDAANNISTAKTDTIIIDTAAEYDLALTISGNGTVVSDEPGINCTSSCVAPYAEDTVVTLTATAETGSVFAGWSGTGGCTGTSTCQLTMTAAKAATATFTKDSYTLDIVYPPKGIIVAGDGIDCGDDSTNCSYEIPSGVITLYATCPDGYYNPTFSGDCTGSSCSLTMTSNKSISVSCKKRRGIKLGAGSVTKLGTGSSNPLPGCSKDVDFIGVKTYAQSNSVSKAANSVGCFLYTPTCYGPLNTAYISHVGTTQSSAKVCVYSDDGDSNPDSGDTLVGCSGSMTSSTNETKSSAMDGGTLSSGSYWVCAAIDDSAGVWWFNRGPNAIYTYRYITASGGFHDTPPANLDGTWATTANTYSLHYYITVGP